VEDLGVYESIVSKFIFMNRIWGADWIVLPQDRNKCCEQGNEPSGLHKMRGNFVILGGNVSFSSRSLLQRVS